MIVNVWLAPNATVCGAAGLMLPLSPAVGVIVYTLMAKLTLIVWSAVTLVNVWLVTAPTETSSTRTSATW